MPAGPFLLHLDRCFELLVVIYLIFHSLFLCWIFSLVWKLVSTLPLTTQLLKGATFALAIWLLSQLFNWNFITSHLWCHYLQICQPLLSLTLPTSIVTPWFSLSLVHCKRNLDISRYLQDSPLTLFDACAPCQSHHSHDFGWVYVGVSQILISNPNFH